MCRYAINISDNVIVSFKSLTLSFSYAADMADLGSQLTSLANEPHGSSNWATGGNSVWADMKKGFHIISKWVNFPTTVGFDQRTYFVSVASEAVKIYRMRLELVSVSCIVASCCTRLTFINIKWVHRYATLLIYAISLITIKYLVL
jgi:hypothetical protein